MRELSFALTAHNDKVEIKKPSQLNKEGHAMLWRSLMRTVLGILLGIFGATAVVWSQASAVVAVRAGRLFDSNSGKESNRQVVLVQGERIIEVGPEDQVKIPPGAQVIDLSQATVLPGMIDGHTHIFGEHPNPITTTRESKAFEAVRNAQISLRAGFTAARDMGSHGNGYGDVDVRNAFNRGIFDGPRLQVSTRGIAAGRTDYAGVPGMTLPGDSRNIHGVEDAREAVREQIHYGADWIKIYPTAGYPSVLPVRYFSIRHIRCPSCKRSLMRRIAIAIA